MCIHHLHTSPAYITCIHHLHTSPAYITCIHHLHTSPAYITCIHHLHTSPAYITCIHHLHTSPAYITCIHHLHTSPAYTSLSCWSVFSLTLFDIQLTVRVSRLAGGRLSLLSRFFYARTRTRKHARTYAHRQEQVHRRFTQTDSFGCTHARAHRVAHVVLFASSTVCVNEFY